ncbi:MAG: hypothetical protein QNL05_10790 [Gammaproteobacteria bacterium]|nr:hypothetical protein [Gammaproteobacteria bacterium]
MVLDETTILNFRYLTGRHNLNITQNYYLIPLHGITGAAAATLVSFAIAGYLSHAFFGKTRGNFIRLTNSFFPVRILNAKGNR